ncbi:MAG: hypothetical protein HY902_16395 [Deltaproteobacteria bacterium]|nr:hypothetical protein [Deltaproteobacteria bacterium]
MRAGWAYGLGGELEYRPDHWGIGVSGGYVPGFGPGGYLGAVWGAAPLGSSGPVAELGLFQGVVSPLRGAPAGLGAFALAGAEWGFASLWSLRMIAGGGVPFTAVPSWRHLEFLAKLTAGVAF